MILWTQILYTNLTQKLIKHMLKNEQTYNLRYHNTLHISEMYRFLHETNEPYDPVLDWAVLAHDVVYDNKPDKETRSAELFYEWAKEVDGHNLSDEQIERVLDMIKSTAQHIVYNPNVSAIIRADLHALTCNLRAFNNFIKIMEESMSLYNCTEYEFAENSEKFMRELHERVSSNIEKDPEHADFYLKVLRGIRATETLACIIQEKE